MSKQKGLLHITFYHFLSRLGQMALLFFINVYAAARLPTAEYGKGQFVIWMGTFSWVVLNLGLPGLLSRYLPMYQAAAQGASLRRLMYVSWQLLLLSLLLALGTVPWIPDGTLYWLCTCVLLFWLQLVNGYLLSFLQGLLLFKKLFRAQLIASALVLPLALLLIPGFQLQGYIYSLLLLYLLNTILLLPEYIRQLKQILHNAGNDSAEPGAKELYRFAAYLAFSSVFAAVLWQRSEFFFIRQLFSYQDLAVYSVALSLIGLFLEPFRMMTGGLTPYFSAIQHQAGKIQDVFMRFYGYFWQMLLAAAVFLYSNAAEINGLLYGEQFNAAIPLIRLLVPAFVIGLASYTVMSLHVAMGKSAFLLLQDVLSAGLILSLCYLLPQHLGIQGIAWAKAGAILFSVLLGACYSIFKLGITFPFRKMILSAVLFILIHVLLGFVPKLHWSLLLPKALLSVALYWFPARWLRLIEAEDIQIIKDWLFPASRP